jgi:chloride channel 7
MLIFVAVWFLFTITTYGVWIPAGLFLPGIILGCSVGSIYETLRLHLFELDNSHADVTPILVGAGAMLGGYTRLTYSLVVIMLETTTSINLFIPMLVGVATARAIGNLFTRSLYDTALRAKQLPVLRSNAPRSSEFIRAEVIMNSELVTLETVCKVSEVH